ncbi:hypothetical protein JCGZ_17902 [Jatropha curcas]|uniref:BAHD acyltransferase n=1 Tax=Jatropha curcas TaxID=180498 RepID=A0A067K4P0_JATCU|nr:acylsugar acyltransferase 3 [Jatropha curcas]KDP26744.1 hypothetical protein JCGZ_17902 [Jatropha curcas]
MIPTRKPEILSTETIKPYCTKQNQHPTIHNLSFFDQISSHIYLPFVFFYTKHVSNTKSTLLLKESLSAALSRYYPLAGRIRDDFSVDCNDEGVDFLEARIDCKLSEILKNPEDETLKILLPDDLQYKDPTLSSLLIVQVTLFECGGMALAICISHKVMDIASMCYFINNWAAIAKNPDEKMGPEFNLGYLYLPIDLPVMEVYEPEKVKCVSKRIVFYGSKIDKLKATAAKEVKNPTRVEVVTAILHKTAISAARARSGSLKSTVMHNAANLRTRLFPPLPESTAGNISGTFPVSTTEESDIEVALLANKINKEKSKYFSSCGKENISAEELCSLVLEASTGLRLSHGSNQDVYLCSSYCRFPFYGADFGWGKPVWVTVANCEVKNVIVLMDTRGGDGIEAYVTLEEHEMGLFESNEELLAFATINPSPLVETNIEDDM